LLEAACELSESKHPDREHDIRRCPEAIIERETPRSTRSAGMADRRTIIAQRQRP